MQAITKKDVEGMFNRFTKALARNEQSIEGLGLDFAAVYGGYVVYRKCPQGGQSHPFSSYRQSKREMYYTLHTATCVLESMIKY